MQRSSLFVAWSASLIICQRGLRFLIVCQQIIKTLRGATRWPAVPHYLSVRPLEWPRRIICRVACPHYLSLIMVSNKGGCLGFCTHTTKSQNIVLSHYATPPPQPPMVNASKRDGVTPTQHSDPVNWGLSHNRNNPRVGHTQRSCTKPTQLTYNRHL